MCRRDMSSNDYPIKNQKDVFGYKLVGFSYC